MDTAREAVADLFRQILSGEDILRRRLLLARLKPEASAERLPDVPYSLLGNLYHAVFWHRVWLGRLTGGKRPAWKDDWKEPGPEALDALRDEFLDGLNRALAMVEAEPFEHRMESDARALHLLMSLAIHDAYHLGQIKLIKRMMATRDRQIGNLRT